MRTIILDNEMLEAISKGRNIFEVNVKYVYFGHEITIQERTEPFKFVNGAGNLRTKSRRYIGMIHKVDGTIIKTQKNDGTGWRGGEIARECGLYVSKEKEDKKKHGDLYEMTNRKPIEH